MKRVIIESPYAASKEHTCLLHCDYADMALRDSLIRGEAPLASHMLYAASGVLKDEGSDRRKGMEAGWAWTPYADAVVVYTDFGVSPGMAEGIEVARKHGIPIEVRKLPDGIFKMLFPPTPDGGARFEPQTGASLSRGIAQSVRRFLRSHLGRLQRRAGKARPAGDEEHPGEPPCDVEWK